MAKNSILDWSATASSNTDIAGIGIQGTNAVSNFDNAFRELMAQVKQGVDYKAVASTKSAGYTAVLNDNNAIVRFTGTYTLTLTAAATLGANWHMAVVADGGNVTIDPNGSETINGATTIVIPSGYSTVIWCDGTSFFAEKDYLRLDPVTDVASATTTDIGAVPSQNIRVTGTTTITSLGTAASGTFRRLRFAGALTLTYNATSLILPGAADITTAAGDFAEFVSDGSGNWRCSDYNRSTGAGLVGIQIQGYLYGLTATTNAGSASTHIDIASGVTANNSSPYYLMQLASGLTKNTNASWAAGTGQGSLDTGSIGDNKYYGFLIQRSDTGVVDVLTSLSSTSPTMPANYDRRSTALFRFTRTSGVNSPPVNLSPIPAKFYESDPQTITAAGLLTLAHGMSAPPKMIAPVLLCVTGENGYSAGDIVPASTQTSTSSLDNYGASFEYSGSTNILVRFGTGSAGNVFIITHKTTGVPNIATSTNWRLIMRAWA